MKKLTTPFMMLDQQRDYRMLGQQRDYGMLAAAWNHCNHFGTISSSVDRINDIPCHLVKLDVAHLMPYLLINEKAKAFVYKADLGRKNLIHVVEIYYDLRPHGTEWREQHARLALLLDVDLADGLDAGVIVTDFVVPFADTAQREVILNYMSDDLRQTIRSKIS